MIITLNNFIEEAKKYKAAFSITSVKEGSIPCFHVKFLLLSNADGYPSSLLITKEEAPRMATKFAALGAAEELNGRTNGETLDNYFQKSMKELGILNVSQLVSELPQRIQMGYTSLGFSFSAALKEHFKTLTLKQQKEFVEFYGLPIIKCPLTKEWEKLSGSLACYVDGVRKTISKKGYYGIGQEQYDLENFGGHRFLWTKDTMPFYMVSGQRVSLYNIIKSPHIYECPDCGALSFYQDEICQVCHPGVTVENIYQQYSARAERVFSFKSKKEDGIKPLFLGVELELENRTSQNLVSTWKILKDHAIIKRDGSVSNGMEICSAPASISVHKEEFKAFFEMAQNSGLEAMSNCGMHVHVDRANLTELQIGKILSFMYNKQNRKLINKIAGRKDNNYCSLAQEKGITSGVFFDEGSGKDYRKKLSRSQSEGRYTGINLAPPNTIEFRIFASTTSYEEFSKNLEFVQSMIDFTRPSAVNVKSIKDFDKQEVYLNFVKENRKAYPNLFQFLKPEII